MKKEAAEILTSPWETVRLLKGYANRKQEHFGIILLDAGRKVIEKKVLFVGGSARCPVDVKVVFWEACKKEASGIILFHNHPNGNSGPSKLDLETTEAIAHGSEILGIELLDHIIVSERDYFSFLEHNLIKVKDKQDDIAAASN